MARLQPTLFIGLGSTGMRVLSSLQKFIMEEYGTWRLPVLQYVVFETNSRADLSEYRSVNFRALSVNNDDIEVVRSRMLEEQQLAQRHPRIDGYFNWLDCEHLMPCEDGVGGNRMLGRFVLWERWGDVRDVLLSAYGRCSSPESRQASIAAIQAYYQRNGTEIAPEGGLLCNDVEVRVVGTLIGGSCSGMFGDFGYLLGSIFPRATRTLTATILSPRDVGDERLYKGKANCFGALSELNFHYQALAPDAWGYRLPDATSSAGPQRPTYNHVYLLSGENGNTILEEPGLNQMMALAHFLDTVGGGQNAKNEAQADVRDEINARNREQRGFVQYFSTYGLGVIWHPKSKITGTAACELAQDFCLRWKGAPEQTSSSSTGLRKEHIDAHSEGAKAWQEFEAYLRRELTLPTSGDRPIANELEHHISDHAAKLNIYRNFNVSLRKRFEEELSVKLEQYSETIERRALQCRKTAVPSLADMVRLRLLEQFKNCALAGEFLRGMKEAAERSLGQAHTPNMVLSENAPKKSPDLLPIRKVLALAESCKRDWVVRSTLLKQEAVRRRRAQYVRRYTDLWRQHLGEHVEFCRRHVANHVLNAWSDIEASAHTLASKVEEVLKVIRERRKEFAELGQAPHIVREVFETNEGFEGDVRNNMRRVLLERDGRTPKAPYPLEFAWLQQGDRLSEEQRSIPAFWSLAPDTIADLLIENYQREGLQHLVDPDQRIRQITQQRDSLRALADAARPYQNFGPDHRPRVDASQCDFIFGHRRDGLSEVAERCGIEIRSMERACHATGLRHMMFIYRETRGIAVNGLDIYDKVAQGEHLRRHAYYRTHKDPTYYDARRFANMDRIGVLMDGANMLPELRARVFEESLPGTFSLRLNQRSRVRLIPVSERGRYTEIAATEGGLEQLTERVRQGLDHWELKEFESNVLAPQFERLEQQRLEAAGNQEAQRLVEQQIRALERFQLEVVEPFYA